MSTQEKPELSPEQQKAIEAAIAWLADKWGETHCPYCNARSWAVGEPVRILAAFPISFGKGGLTPAFTVMCGNCGHTNLINAIVAEIVPEEEQ
jgi:hypothetical protein